MVSDLLRTHKIPVHMSIMSKGNGDIQSQSIEGVSKRLSELYEEADNIGDADNERDTGLASERGRSTRWGGIKSIIRRAWDEATKPRAVEKILQRKLMGKASDEQVQRKKEKAREGSLRIAKFTETLEFEVHEKFFSRIESFAYYALRHPEMFFNESDPSKRGRALSPDYYLGFYNGQLSVVEDYRTMIRDTVSFAENEKKRIEKEAVDERSK